MGLHGKLKETICRWARRAWVPGLVLHIAIGASHLNDSDLLDDEIFSLVATHRLWETLTHTHGTMASYYAVLTPWSWISSSPWWLRLLSLLPMAGATAVLAKLVERQAGVAAARWAGSFAAVAFLPVRFSYTARSYGMLALLVALSWLLLDLAVAGDRSSRPWYLACLVLLPLTHGLAVLQVVVQVVAIVWARPDRWLARRLLGAATTSIVIGGLLYLHGARAIGASSTPFALATIRVFTRRMFIPTMWAFLPIVAIAAVGARRCFVAGASTPSERLRQVSLLLWGGGAVVALFLLNVARPSLIDRYAIASPFGLAGLVAIGIVPMRPTRWRLAAPVLVLGALLLGHTELPTPARPWTEAAGVVSSRATVDDVMVFATIGDRLGFEAVIGSEHRLLPRVIGPNGELGAIDRFESFDRFGPFPSPAQVAAAVRDAPRIWVLAKTVSEGTSAPTSPLLVDALTGSFSPTDRWQFHGAITVVLLEADR